MTKLIEHRGTRYTTSEVSRISGVSVATIRQRLNSGWTTTQAIGTPTPKQRRAGVISNLPAFEGTGAGRSVQENPEIIFHKEAAE